MAGLRSGVCIWGFAYGGFEFGGLYLGALHMGLCIWGVCIEVIRIFLQFYAFIRIKRLLGVGFESAKLPLNTLTVSDVEEPSSIPVRLTFHSPGGGAS